MSQILSSSVAGTPSVPTSVTTDQQDSITSILSAPNGTVVPQINILRIGGDNGIATYQVVNQPGAMTIGFIRGGPVTTTNIQTTAVITQPVPTNSTMTLQIIASGFADNSDGVGIYGNAVVKNVAGVVSIISQSPIQTVDKIVNADASLTGVDLNLTVSANTFTVNVVGVAGRTITWEAALPGIIVS
jgi:hypothetical protein